MNLHFKTLTVDHLHNVFSWLGEPHIQEYWDNSEEHGNNIINFAHGTAQTYFAGIAQYWIGFIGHCPYALTLSDILKHRQEGLT